MPQQKQVDDWQDVQDWQDVSAPRADARGTSTTAPAFRPTSATPMQVAGQQASTYAARLKERLANLPSDVASIPGGILSLVKTISGSMSLDPQSMEARAKLGMTFLDAAQRYAQPFSTATRGAAELAVGKLPESVQPQIRRAMAAYNPGLTPPPPPEHPEWTQAAQGTADISMDVATAKALQTLAKAPQVVQRLKASRAAQTVTKVEQKLAPSGANSKILAKEVAPELAKDPVLAAAKSGPAFDTALHGKFREAGNLVKQVEAAIPDGTPVPTAPIIEKFDDLITAYQDMGADEAARALTNQANRIARIPGESMPWSQFIEFKRRFGNDLQRLGVWKRINAGMATERDIALSQAYGQMMEASSGVSKELAAANARFSTMNDALRAAGISAEDGRRIAAVGVKPPPTRLRRVVTRGAEVIGLTALGATGWRIYQAATD